MKKRLLSLPLVLALCVGLFAAPALADGPDRMGAATTFIAGIGYIDADGALWMWGSNYVTGILEENFQTYYDFPVKVMEDVVSFSSTGSHTAAIKTDGSLWVWGNNTYGQLGNGREGDRKTYLADDHQYAIKCYQTYPIKLMDDVAAVSCRNEMTAILKTDGTLWTCGACYPGQLGNGGVWNGQDEEGREYQTVPLQILDNVVAVSCGTGTVAAIRTDGSLWMWGRNSYGELGSEVWNAEYKVFDRVLNVYQTVPIKVMDDVAAVNCQFLHTVALKTDGSLWNWGNDCAPYPKRQPPTKLMDDVVAFACESAGFAAVKSDGSLWTWGRNTYGQLGNGGVGEANGERATELYQTSPLKIMDNVAAVSCLGPYSAALKTDGTLWTWGRNDDRDLGIGDVWNAEVLFGIPVQNVPAKLADNVKLPVAPTLQIAYPSTQTVGVNSWEEELQFYAIKDKNGNLTNYVKLRDLANLLNTTAAEFQVGWDGSVVITTRTPYTPNGSEGNNPFSGARTYQKNTAITKVNGEPVDLDAFVLTDDQGGGYTYYKLRDLGRALNFNVGWSGDRGVFIEAHKPYDPND